MDGLKIGADRTGGAPLSKGAPASLLERHRVPPAEVLLTARQEALTRGYLRQALESPRLVLIYTDGMTLKKTEIAYLSSSSRQRPMARAALPR
jgi:hypothetical protein